MGTGWSWNCTVWWVQRNKSHILDMYVIYIWNMYWGSQRVQHCHVDNKPHRIHVGIFPYMYHENRPNVGIYGNRNIFSAFWMYFTKVLAFWRQKTAHLGWRMWAFWNRCVIPKFHFDGWSSQKSSRRTSPPKRQQTSINSLKFPSLKAIQKSNLAKLKLH